MTPPDDSTCIGGGRSDYFVTNGARKHIHGGCCTVPGKVRPHSPVLMKVKYRPHLTKVSGFVRVGLNLAEGLENVTRGTSSASSLSLSSYSSSSSLLAGVARRCQKGHELILGLHKAAPRPNQGKPTPCTRPSQKKTPSTTVTEELI